MNYLLELYDASGKKVYNVRAPSPGGALEQLAYLNRYAETYPFVTATCYLDQKVVWEFERKIP